MCLSVNILSCICIHIILYAFSLDVCIHIYWTAVEPTYLWIYPELTPTILPSRCCRSARIWGFCINWLVNAAGVSPCSSVNKNWQLMKFVIFLYIEIKIFLFYAGTSFTCKTAFILHITMKARIFPNVCVQSIWFTCKYLDVLFFKVKLWD